MVATASEDAAIGQWPVAFEVRPERDIGATERVPVAFVVRGKPGTLDTSFAENGVFALGPQRPAAGTFPPGAKLARRKDGSLLVAWTVLTDPPTCAVVSLDRNGLRDANFAARGPAFEDAAGCALRDMTVGADDEIIVATSLPSTTDAAGLVGIAISRLTRDGNPDLAFGAGGVVQSPAKVYGSPAPTIDTRVGTSPLGQILVSGHRAYAEQTIEVARHDRTGKLDATFGANGVTTLVGEGAGGSSFVQPDGRVLLPYRLSFDKFRVMRLDTSGNRDLSFGESGIIALAPAFGITERVAIAPDGNIVVAVTMLFGFDREGKGSAAFGDAGAAVLRSGYPLSADIAFPSERIALVLHTAPPLAPTTPSFFLARFTMNGMPDEDFAPGGLVEVKEPGIHRVMSLVVQDDGAFVITTYLPASRLHADASGDPELVIMRFYP